MASALDVQCIKKQILLVLIVLKFLAHIEIELHPMVNVLLVEIIQKQVVSMENYVYILIAQVTQLER